LCQFLKSLCRASREQLYRSNANKKGKKTWWLGRPWKVKNQSLPLSLLLHRVGESTLKVFRSSRPLLHILKIWSISGPHLMEAACHKDRDISKRAIEYIHDIITALLVEQTELPHFHFNEALLKPFENILNMQNCDSDVQDQIITCCMMIVEAHRTEIRSGWRPLFGTLTTKKLNINGSIIDIFRIFLETENTLVFANAGLDCILCLLSYLETSSGNSDEDTNNNGEGGRMTSIPNSEFLHDVLKFLERCSTILGCLYNMPNTPNLHSTYKIKGISYTHIVDANTQNTMENFQYFGNEHLQNINDQFMISYRSLHIDKDSITKLEELEKNGCGVLKVWFLLLDGLTNALILCPQSHQSPIIQTIFKIFRSVFENPGIDFGFYCVNHLLIPLNQDWLRYINKTQKNWATLEKNFKHCCCMTTDLVVEFIEKSQFQPSKHKIDVKNPTENVDEEEMSRIPTAANLALKQLLLVLIECSVQPQEAVSRIGVSCLKHIIFTIGYLFNEDQWLTICSAIHRAATINLAPLRQLSFAFHENSNSFYGDIATLKVAARRDCTLEEINRVYSLSQQVFQLDNQKDSSVNKASSEIKIINEDRSYAFLLYPNLSADGNFVLRIPYRNLVIGLLVSQMLLQLIANILLGGLKCVAQTELHSVIYEYNTSSATNNDKKPQFSLSYRAKEILYRCLRQFLNCSIEFDYRPGLKFLLQKVSNLDFAANLYKQLTSSFIIIFMSLVDVYLSDIEKLNLSTTDLKYIIESSSGDNMIKKKEFFVRNLYSLREIWDQIADLYVKAVKISPSPKRKESFATEINIVENKMVEIQDQLNNFDSDGDDDDDVFLPPIIEKNANLEKAPSEESVKIFQKDQDESPKQQRENPFNNVPETKQQVVSPEIEQQRKMSILKDEQCKRKSLTQLIVASMELLKLLPNESTENIRLLLTPKINEAFDMISRLESSVESLK
jgi:brefeldin A-inhibited guanine nucleotide-exchange protein 3